MEKYKKIMNTLPSVIFILNALDFMPRVSFSFGSSEKQRRQQTILIWNLLRASEFRQWLIL